VDPRARLAELAVQALRAVLSQLSPSPAWRAELADMAADALAAAKGVCPRDVWAEGWQLVYIERARRAKWKAALTSARPGA